MTARGRAFTYDVFLSYAREDSDQALALERGLQRFDKPWYRPRAMRVFRDQSQLCAGPDLWAELDRWLAASTWLVLLASPDAAQSGGVQHEVRWWRAHRSDGTDVRRITNFLIVHTAGVLHFSDAGIDWNLTDCLPQEALDGAFTAEPVWAELLRRDPKASQYRELLPAALGDIRAVASRIVRGRKLAPDEVAASKSLRECIVDIAAPVRDETKERLIGGHRKQARRTATTVVATLVTIAALLIGLTVVRAHVDEIRRRNVAAQLVNQITTPAIETDPQLALKVAIVANAIHPDSHTLDTLVNTLSATRYRGTLGDRSGEGTAVHSTAFSPNGPLAVTAAPRAVSVWNIADPGTPRFVAPINLPPKRFAASVTFSPDGHLLAVGDSLGTVTLYDLREPRQPRYLGDTTSFRHQPPGTTRAAQLSVMFTPDGEHLVIGTGDNVPTVWYLRDPSHPTQVSSLPADADVNAVAISWDGHTVAAGDSAGATLLWDVTDPRKPRALPPLAGHSGGVLSVAFSADGLLASGDQDGTIALWNATNPAKPVPLRFPRDSGAVTAVAFAPRAALLATGSVNGHTRLWDVHNPAAPQPIDPVVGADTDAIRAIAFTPGGRLFATSDDSGATRLWSAADPVEPHLLGPAPTGNLSTVTLDPDGRELAVQDDNDAVSFLDVSQLTHPRRIGALPTDDAVVDVAYAPVGHTLAAAGDTVTLWDTRDPGSPHRLGTASAPETTRTDFRVPAASVAFSPDARLLAALFEDGVARLWDVRDLRSPRPVGPPITCRIPKSGHNGVSEFAFSADSHTLVVGCYSGSVDLWDITEPAQATAVSQPLPDQPAHRSFTVSLAFSPRGSLLAAASGNEIVILWDVSDPGNPVRLGPPLDQFNSSGASDVAFSPDGTLLVTSASDASGGTTVRDVTDPTSPVSLGRPVATGAVGAGSLAFTRGGRTVVVGSANGAVVAVDLTALLELRDHAVQRACAIAGGGMDEDQWTRYVADPNVPYRPTCARH